MKMFTFVAAAFVYLTVTEAAVYTYKYTKEPVLEMSIGTPEQGPFLFEWELPLYTTALDGPIVTNKAFGGVFNYNASSTFKYSRSDKSDVYGTDMVKPKGGTFSFNVNVAVFMSDLKVGVVDLNMGQRNKPSFIKCMFANLRSKHSIAFKVLSQGSRHDGALIIGDPRPSGCTDWTQYSAFDSGNFQMAFYAKMIEIERYRRTGLIAMTIGFDNITFDRETYAAAVRELYVVDGKIDCGTTSEIVITAADNVFKIGPKDYIKKKSEKVCEFAIMRTTQNMITLPLRFLYKRCLSYDYGRRTVSIGTLSGGL